MRRATSAPGHLVLVTDERNLQMRRRTPTPTGVLTVATVAAGLLLPLAPATSAADPWAPARAGPGHPKGMVTLDNGMTIAVSDGGWVTRRSAGESAWSPVRHEIDERRKSRTRTAWVMASGNSLIASFADSTKFGTYRSTYVWRPGAGWSKSVDVKGLVWAGANGVVGIDRKRFVPGRGWTTLPEIPLGPRAMAADAKGRISAVGKRNGSLRITRFTPGHGWARPVRFTGADRSGSVSLAVNPRGDRAITVGVDRRTLLFRKLGDGDWRRFVVDRRWPNEHQVQLDRFGRASVVWTRYTGQGDDPVLARRLSRGSAWTPIRLLGNGFHGLAVDGTPSGRLAVAYGNGQKRNGASHVMIRSADNRWGDPVKVAPYGNNLGLALSNAGCATGYAWTGRFSRFTARTLGSCAGAEPEPADPRAAWDRLAGPAGERADRHGRADVVRTSDGHTLLVWQQYDRIRAAERIGSGFGDVASLNPPGADSCHVKLLAAVDTRLQATLDCYGEGYPRGPVERTWTAASGWNSAARLPVRGVDLPMDISGEGRMAVAVDPGYDRRVDKVAYRGSLDGRWTTLPRPPRFTSPYLIWSVHVTDAGDVVLLDEFGREYVTYRASTGAWSPVRKAPITSWNGEFWDWRVTDSGFLMTTATGYREQRVAVGKVGGTWRKANPLPGAGRCRSFHLSDDGTVTVVETAASCGKRTALRSRDLAAGATTWSRATVIGRGAQLQQAYLYGNADGALLVRLAHAQRFGFARPDTLWRRAAGSTWSEQEYVPGGYGLRGTVLADGTFAVTTPYRTLAPWSWLSLHD